MTCGSRPPRSSCSLTQQGRKAMAHCLAENCFMAHGLSRGALEYHFPRVFSHRIALHIWGPSMANRCICFVTDNCALVYIINRQTSKNKLIMSLVSLYFAQLQHSISGSTYRGCTQLLCRSSIPLSGQSVKTNFSGGGRNADVSTRPPSAEELVASLNELLSTALSARSRKLHSPEWTVFQEFYERFVSSYSLR